MIKMHAGKKVYDNYELKVYCDICGKQDEGKDFRAELKTAERMINLGNKDPFPQPQVKNATLHFCYDCYKEIIKPKLYAGEKKEA